MADNYISGNNGYVALGGQVYTFGKWDLDLDGGTKKFFAFGTGGQLTTPGGYAGTLTCEGAYNVGNMPLTVNSLYVFHLGLDTGLEFAITARVSNIKVSNEISAGGEPAGITITADSHGNFTAGVT